MINTVSRSDFVGVDVRVATESGLIFGEDMALAAGFSNPESALGRYVDSSDKVTSVQVRLEDGSVVTPVLLTEKGYFDLVKAAKAENKILFGLVADLLPIRQACLQAVITLLRKHLTPELEEKVIAALHDEDAFNDLLREYNRICREEMMDARG